MPERSQEKGRTFQRTTKGWLLGRNLLGYEVSEYADAYDPTSDSACIGGKQFDFCLKLKSRGEVRQLLYAECKYRNEASGSVDSDFRKFLLDVHDAIRESDSDKASAAQFIFLSNLPPRDWRKFLKAKTDFLNELIEKRDETAQSDLVAKVSNATHVLVLSQRVIEVR